MSEAREAVIGRLLLGESPAIRALRADILRYAPTRLPVLVQGPTGSGKELVARALHLASGRTGALVAFNVCALGDGMFEDAMFGHVRGAFTGASHESAGYFAEANGGTIFMDEISGLGMKAQAKLLRAVETGEFRALGGARDRQSDFRLVSATNERLADICAAGRFRLDLMYRLGGCVLTVPGLDERRDDVPLLAQHFLHELSGGRAQLSDRALDRLRRTHWQGNVRQLRHAMERVAAVATSRHVTTVQLEATLGTMARDEEAEASDVEWRDHLRATLETHAWDTASAARALNVHRATVYRWMTRMRISVPPSAQAADEERTASMGSLHAG